MKHTFLAMLLIAQASLSFSQTDSTKTVKLNTSLTLATKNIWRGVNYGNNAPMIQGSLGVVLKDAFEIGACGTATLNGDKRGFGNWMELYTQYQWRRWTVVLDDYYFFSYDSLNDYLNWNNKTTQHLLEARLKFEVPKKISVMAGYNIYANQSAKKALYVEAEYFLFQNFSILFGAVTGASWLNYYDAGGITTVGVSGNREIPISKKLSLPLKAQLIVNPNYKNIAVWDGSGYVDPGYNYLGRNAINFVISTTL
jgi:hypothetical protein